MRNRSMCEYVIYFKAFYKLVLENTQNLAIEKHI